MLTRRDVLHTTSAILVATGAVLAVTDEPVGWAVMTIGVSGSAIGLTSGPQSSRSAQKRDGGRAAPPSIRAVRSHKRRSWSTLGDRSR